MRTEQSLSSVLDIYRDTARTVGGLALVLAALAAASLEAALSGRGHLVWLLGAAIALSGGLIALVRLGYNTMREALEQAETQRRAHLALAHRDALTGVLTRKHFLEEFNRRLRRASDAPLAYLQLDMDHLKAINDGNGHGAGDAALVRISAAISQTIPNALVGRLGGDEFAIVVEGVGSRSALRRLGQRLLEAIDAPFVHAGREMRLSATVGLAVAPDDAATVDALMSKADLALYKGKRSGRRAVVAFEAEMLAEERHQRFVERELRAAILMSELELHYQPVYAGDRLAISGVEALVRWKHPVRGLIAPSEFVRVAEHSDLIDKLGEWVLRRALRDIEQLDVPTVAINVSAAELKRPDFSRRFLGVLNQNGVAGNRLVVEVTETAPLRAGAVELINLRALREAGVRIAIDDFGAGHASLAYLRDFPFDVIKIDRTYIANMLSSRVDAMLVEAVGHIAGALGVEVVAEGIETESQLIAARRAGCTGFQGYWLARPAPLETLSAGTRTDRSAA